MHGVCVCVGALTRAWCCCKTTVCCTRALARSVSQTDHNDYLHTVLPTSVSCYPCNTSVVRTLPDGLRRKASINSPTVLAMLEVRGSDRTRVGQRVRISKVQSRDIDSFPSPTPKNSEFRTDLIMVGQYTRRQTFGPKVD
jgi:hypothetical protein